MIKSIPIITFILLLPFLAEFSANLSDDEPTIVLSAETGVWEVLTKLGEPMPNHEANPSISGASAERGAELTLTGFASKPSGGGVRKQSKHFVCTSCHNVQREEQDLTKSDPQSRLEYAKEHNLPFLQATTLYGAVNRMSFYNGDYEKKYGKLVEPARNDLREAIQLCAVECAQGRALEDWELESILQYLWTLELKLEDLDLPAGEIEKIQALLNANASSSEKTAAIKMIKGRYLQGSPAHFTKPPPNRREGYALTGNPENGKLVYDLSCKHCHENKRYSFFQLDDSPMTFKYLKKHIGRYSHASIYQVIRYGQQPLYGKRSYMPQYTQEKMSDQQLEDLRSYIEMKAD